MEFRDCDVSVIVGRGDTMLIQHVPLLATKRIVLASASPRRSELLRGLVRFVPIFDISVSILCYFRCSPLDLAH